MQNHFRTKHFSRPYSNLSFFRIYFSPKKTLEKTNLNTLIVHSPFKICPAANRQLVM